MKESFFKKIGIFASGISIGTALAFGGMALAAWSEPTTVPPNCADGLPGCSTPIDVSSVRQIKNGDMGANRFIADYIISNRGVRFMSNKVQSCTAGVGGTEGMIRYNAIDYTPGKLQYCDGVSWRNI